MHRSIAIRAWPKCAVASATALLTLSSCMFKEVREQQAEIDAHCLLTGTVATVGESAKPIVVGLARHTTGDVNDPKSWTLADHFVLENAGRWMFRASPGRYGFVAFEDRNADGVYQPTEPFLRAEPAKLITCVSNERKLDIALAIPAQGTSRLTGPIDFSSFNARSVGAQEEISLGQLTVSGKLTTIDDKNFTDEVAGDGLWKPYDFLLNVGAGVYFLEPYDTKKIPVLFVHGINGHPANFKSLLSKVDRKKYQPWLYYYPSGAHLDVVAGHLDQTMKQLQLEYGFTRHHVIAHSMGGLVSRGFLLRNQTTQTRSKVPLYITIATPWAGHKSAESGVKWAPTVVRVWNDMVPDSPYIHGLFFEGKSDSEKHRALPATLQHHLLFAFQDDSRGECTDGTVTVASQLYSGAQSDAVRLYGHDETHMSILDSDAVSKLVNDLLDKASQ